MGVEKMYIKYTKDTKKETVMKIKKENITIKVCKKENNVQIL